MVGFHNQCLCMVGAAQPDWILHVLWAVYEKCYDFFQMKLSEEDLMEGAMLINPVTVLNGCILEFKKIEQPSCPESLLMPSPTFSPMPTQQDNGGYITNKNGKQNGQRGGGNPGGNNKVKMEEGEEVQQQQNFWNENKVFHASLKAAKQEIIEKNGLETAHQPPPNKKQKMQQPPNDRHAEREKQAHPKVNLIQEKILQPMDRSTRVNGFSQNQQNDTTTKQDKMPNDSKIEIRGKDPDGLTPIQIKYSPVFHGRMRPDPSISQHPAYATLFQYATEGCPVDCGEDWTREHIKAAIRRRPH